MPEYFQFLTKGIEAAKSAKVAQSEIRRIINQMSDDILSATGNTLKIEIANNQLAEIAATLNLNNKNKESYNYRLVAKNLTAPSTAKPFADFTIPYEGYPCTLRYDSVSDRCHDAESLRDSLKCMLQNASVAHIIDSVLNPGSDPDTK